MKNSFLVLLLLCVFTVVKSKSTDFHQQKEYNIKDFGAVGIDGNGTSFMGKELADSYELKPFLGLCWKVMV